MGATYISDTSRQHFADSPMTVGFGGVSSVASRTRFARIGGGLPETGGICRKLGTRFSETLRIALA